MGKRFVFQFDDSSPFWVKDYEENKKYLALQVNYFNRKLRADGIVFLNEFLEAVSIPRVKQGYLVGWVWHTPSCEAIRVDFTDCGDGILTVLFDVDEDILEKVTWDN